MLTLWLPVELLPADIRVFEEKGSTVKEFQGMNKRRIGRKRAGKKQNLCSIVSTHT